MCTGARYLGYYIGGDESKGNWLKDCMEKWERDIRDLRKMADRYPQKSYAAMAHAVQSEWIFMKCVMKDTVQVFKGLEIFMQGNFLPRLFFGKPKILPPNCRISKYVAGEEIRNGITEPCDVGTGEIHQLDMCK